MRSVNDAFVNGAFFREVGSAGRPNYGPEEAFVAAGPNEVEALTRDAGALRCGSAC